MRWALRRRREEPPTEELSWNSWVGRRPDAGGAASYPISAETAERRVGPGGQEAGKAGGRAGARRRGPLS
jgi:hypothetical protein